MNSMKTRVKSMPAKEAVSVLELPGLLQGKGADGANQTDKHQQQARERDRRGPEQQCAGAHEKRASKKVESGRRKRRHSAPAREQCNLDAHLRAAASVGRPRLRGEGL